MFETGVARSSAVLLEPPDYWSYSALKECATCPLRYSLVHASYPALWSGRGYPSPPSAPQLIGNVVHGALEVVLRALADAGVASPHSEDATRVLRELGGLTLVIEAEIAGQLAPLETNPRLTDERRRRLDRLLHEQGQHARAQVQTYLSRTRFVPGTAKPERVPKGLHHPQTSQRKRHALVDGSHSEVWLVADDLRLHGRVDLLTVDGELVEIVDYKTGADSPSHADQLRLYALLWSADNTSNPRHLTATRLAAAYRDHDRNVAVPGPAEMSVLSAQVEAEIITASREAGAVSPVARPSVETCASCSVRHLCPAYWASVAPRMAPTQEDCWFDLEGVIGDENGRRSWWLLDAAGTRKLLLRSATSDPGFVVGDVVRLLGLHRESDPDVAFPIGTIAAASEVFVLEAVG